MTQLRYNMTVGYSFPQTVAVVSTQDGVESRGVALFDGWTICN